MRKLTGLFLGALLAAGIGCGDVLEVDNQNNPDKTDALSRPNDVAVLIANSYVSVHNATIGGSNDGLQPQLLVAALESYSGLANFNMGTRALIPRLPLSNQIGNNGQVGNFRDWQVLYRAARLASDGLKAVEELKLPTTIGRDMRSRMFARFVQGVALGTIAMVYDSGMVVSEEDNTTPPAAPPAFVSYDSLMKHAIFYLDSSIALANAAPDSSFPIPNTYIAGSALADRAAFIRLVRSYRARMRAGVARTKAERDAVNWTLVTQDALNGITADLAPLMDASGWDVVWPIQHYLYDTWHQQPMPIIAMADTAGLYNTWLATPFTQRQPFLIRTSDRRFPSGDTRDAQITFSGGTSASATPPNTVIQFRNRPAGNDRIAEPWANSFYDFYKFRAFFNAGRIGTYPVMTRAEMDLLAAEGHIRAGNFALAIPLINKWRTNASLPALPLTMTDTVQRIPDLPGSRCVPRIPDPATNYTTSKCGNIWEAMKWEYRMETAYRGYGMWYFASRGWQDLPEGTPLHWPVPYQEMFARGRRDIYDMGGIGGRAGAPRGNYGL